MNVLLLAIAAMDESRVIGIDNTIPWHIPEDMARFKQLTGGCAVMMGRKTFDSLPDRFKPLPNRLNIVVTRNPDALAEYPSLQLTSDPVRFVSDAKAGKFVVPGGRLWVIGGSEVYRATLPLWDELYLTLVAGTHKGDAYFPSFEEQFELAEEEKRNGYVFRRYQRRNQSDPKNAP